MIIEQEHFRYLVIQRGEVSEYRKDFKAWKEAYQKSLMGIYSSIQPVLPDTCKSVLDIGSGLGGIDLLLLQHYRKLHIQLLDGLDNPADVNWHNKPFSNEKVALDFHAKNGSTDVLCCYPTPKTPRKFDLIVSFAAYCFHIYPGDYLDVVQNSMHEDTVLIFDVRRRSDWLEMLVQAFGKPVMLKQEKKYVRLAFKCKQSSSSVEAGA